MNNTFKRIQFFAPNFSTNPLSRIEEISPLLVTKITDESHMRLLQLLCRAKGVKVLTLGFTRFGYRYHIGPDSDVLPRYNEPKENSNKTFK